MIKRYILVFLAMHFVLSAVCFFGLYGWGVAVQDADAPSATVAWLEFPLRYGLLQPLAHWLLDSGAIAWWTWPGMLTVLLLLGLNSLAASGALAAILAAVGYYRGQPPVEERTDG
ncbi:MAG: hypothetical protein PVH89_02440 [Gammaproteobacteria bacterium]